MASAPRGYPEGDFEAEETAILAAVGDAQIDLVVEESGDPSQLGTHLAQLGEMSALHLSCYGMPRYPHRRPP